MIDLILVDRVVEEVNRLISRAEVWNVSLEFVDDAKISALNKKYSGESEPTDVLSFSYQEDGFKVEGELGDIAINIEAAERQSQDLKVPVEHEVALLLAHGLLHLLGFDHREQSEKDEMAALQTKIADRAGIINRKFEWK